MCKYAYYDENEKHEHYPELYCKIKGGKATCLYRKRCLKEGRYILIEGEPWRDCYIMNDYERSNVKMPSDAYAVITGRKRPNGSILLYVKYNGNTITADFDGADVPKYVYIKKTDKGYLASEKAFIIEEPINTYSNIEDAVYEPKNNSKKGNKRSYKKKQKEDIVDIEE